MVFSTLIPATHASVACLETYNQCASPKLPLRRGRVELELHDRKPLWKLFGANKSLDTSLTVPPLWRNLGVTLWQF
jgi:hypothetical protein